MNKPLRCLIVDSDPEARSDLVAQLAAHAEIHVLAAVKTVAEAIPLLSLVPDVIFLDASLAELNKLAPLSAGLPAYLTVALARDVQGAFAAYENYAIDFLLKPYTPQRIARSVTKLFIHVAGAAVLTAAALRRGTPLFEASKVTRSRGTDVVKMGDVSLIKAAGNYARITRNNGISQMLRRTMVALVKELANTPFFRVDRSALINLEHVVRYQRISRVKARLQLNGLKEPMVLGRRAIARFEKVYRAHPA